MKILKESDILKPLKIQFNNGDSVSAMSFLYRLEEHYTIDWDVKLKNGKNLQCPFCWTLEQKQELVMPVLKGIPIQPFVFVFSANQENGKYVLSVIDGKQRLNALPGFYHGEFPIAVDGDEFYFENLDDRLKYRIRDFDPKGHVADEITVSSKKDNWITKPFEDEDLIALFERINFSGTPQDKQHLTNLRK